MHLRILPIESDGEARQELEEIAVGPAALSRLIPKMRHLVVRVEGISCPAANVLKQELLALGGDAAVGQGVVECRLPEAQAILMGTVKQLSALSRRLAKQPYGLKLVGDELSRLLGGLPGANFVLRCGPWSLDLNSRTHLMGLVSVNPGERFLPQEMVSQGLDLQGAGADIIELRVQSRITPLEEKALLVPIVARLAAKARAPISVKTSNVEVAEAVLKAGAHVINDMTGLGSGPALAQAVSAGDAGLILGSGVSAFSQMLPCLKMSLDQAIQAGVGRTSLVIYPGNSPGTERDHKLLLRRLSEFTSLGQPILLGPFDLPGPMHDNLEEAYARAAVGILNGAKIIATCQVSKMHRLATALDSVYKSS